MICYFFFFQAEDGIRDKLVTGVQTCALPIFGGGAGGLRAADGRVPVRWILAASRGRAPEGPRCIEGGVADADFLRGAAPGRGNARRCHGNSWAAPGSDRTGSHEDP